LFARGRSRFGAFLIEGEGLLDENMLAGARCCGNVLGMKRVRCRKQDRIDLLILENCLHRRMCPGGEFPRKLLAFFFRPRIAAFDSDFF
jgi:hypothetical protein